MRAIQMANKTIAMPRIHPITVSINIMVVPPYAEGLSIVIARSGSDAAIPSVPCNRNEIAMLLSQ